MKESSIKNLNQTWPIKSLEIGNIIVKHFYICVTLPSYSEMIYGYGSVSIQLFYLHNSMQSYLKIDTSGKISRTDVPPDNIFEQLEPWLQDFTTEEDVFLKMLDQEKHDQIFGNLLKEFVLDDGKGNDSYQ